MELTLFREVLAHGSTEEQVAAVDALAFIYVAQSGVH
jgi:hypothetical protein